MDWRRTLLGVMDLGRPPDIAPTYLGAVDQRTAAGIFSSDLFNILISFWEIFFLQHALLKTDFLSLECLMALAKFKGKSHNQLGIDVASSSSFFPSGSSCKPRRYLEIN